MELVSTVYCNTARLNSASEFSQRT